MVFPFFFLLFIVWDLFFTRQVWVFWAVSVILVQASLPHLILLFFLLFCFSLFPQWISLLWFLLCFVVIFCSSFCFFFLRVFFTARFYPWFPSFPSLFSLLCYSLDIQRKWEYLVSVLSYSRTPFSFCFLLSLLKRRNLFLFSYCSNFIAL